MASTDPVTLSDGSVQLRPQPAPEGALCWSVERVGGSSTLGNLTLRDQQSPQIQGSAWTRAWLDVDVPANADSARINSLAQAVRLVSQWAFAALGLSVIAWRGPTIPALRAILHTAGFHVHPLPQRRSWDSEGGVQDAWFADLLPHDAEPIGVRPLTAREHQVLALMAQGLSNQRIAQALGISENTVKNHVRAILDALRATSRTAAVVLALQSGLVGFTPQG